MRSSSVAGENPAERQKRALEHWRASCPAPGPVRSPTTMWSTAAAIATRDPMRFSSNTSPVPRAFATTLVQCSAPLWGQPGYIREQDFQHGLCRSDAVPTRQDPRLVPCTFEEAKLNVTGTDDGIQQVVGCRNPGARSSTPTPVPGPLPPAIVLIGSQTVGTDPTTGAGRHHQSGVVADV